MLAGQDSRQQPHRCAGVSRVERPPTAFQATQPAAGHPNGILLDFHFRAQRAHAGQRAVAIGCRGKMTQLAGPFGERRQHPIAMRNGFVPGKVQPAGQIFSWPNGLFFHAEDFSTPSLCVWQCGQRFKFEAFSFTSLTSFTSFASCTPGQFL